MKTSAILFAAANHIECGEIEIPAPDAGEVWVRVDKTAISPGTELRVLSGGQPGHPPFPFVSGYNAVGRVERVGADVDLAIGTRVLSRGTTRADVGLMWGGHCARHLTSPGRLTVISENLSDADALMVRLAAIAYRGVRLSQMQPDETVIIIGLGPVGQCSARLFAALGARVLCLDRFPERVELLKRQGLDARAVADDMVRVGREVFPDGADIVVDASGAAAVALLAPQLLRDVPWDNEEHRAARYVVQGSYPETVAFPYNALFQREAAVLFPRDSKASDSAAVIGLLEAGQLALGDLISRTVEPREAPDIYRRLQAGQGDLLTAAFDWRTS